MVTASSVAGVAKVAGGPCQGTSAVLSVATRRVPVRSSARLQVKVGQSLNVSTLSGCAQLFSVSYPDAPGIFMRDGSGIAAQHAGTSSLYVMYSVCAHSNPPCIGIPVDLAAIPVRVVG
jgi:hypothetical protein